MPMRERARNEWRDVRALRRVVATVHPELLYIWNMGGLTRSLLKVAQDTRLPIVYDIFDNWLAIPVDTAEWTEFWQRQPYSPLRRALKAPLRWALGGLLPMELPALDLRHVLFKSVYLKQAALRFGRPVEQAPVLYHGVRLGDFRPRSERDGRPEGDCRVLYVGQVAPHKGVHTLLEALALLAEGRRGGDLSLTVAGSGLHPEYEEGLRATAQSPGLVGRVHFRGMVPHTALPELYRGHDLLVFPSTWEEPFGLTQIEAMASGIPVIGTGTGGSGEILRRRRRCASLSGMPWPSPSASPPSPPIRAPPPHGRRRPAARRPALRPGRDRAADGGVSPGGGRGPLREAFRRSGVQAFGVEADRSDRSVGSILNA